MHKEFTMQDQRLNLQIGNNPDNYRGGFSLIELIVVLALFTVLMVVTSQVLISSLRSVRKAEASSVVRANVDYAISIVERHLRNAKEITTCNTNMSTLNYVTFEGISAWFSCQNISGNVYIASGSAVLPSVRLTGEEVSLTQCSFDCVDLSPADNVPPSVIVNVRATHRNIQGAEGVDIIRTSKINLRVY